MKTKILFNVASVLGGVIVGYLVYRFSGEHDFTIGLLSIVTGILIIIMMEVIFQPYTERKEFNELVTRINFLAEKVSDRFVTASELSDILKYGHVRIGLSRVTDVWLDRIWQTHHRYWGVLYAAPKEVTITSVFQLGLSVMAAKVRVEQVDVKRIFLLETNEDLIDSKEAMRACSQHRLQVRYLFRKQMDTHTLLKQRVSHLSTLDFTIYDSNIIWLIMLDKGRHIQHGELFFDEKINEQYSEVFRLMWEAATPYQEPLMQA
jgi:hypothetical protein